MSTQAHEVKSAPTQPPRELEGRRGPTGGRTPNLWLAVVVALVLGVVAGYFLRWGTEPTTTSTRTITSIATKTVAPPAFAGDHVTVHVSYDGTRCLYQGPGELKAGSTVEVKYSSTVPDSTWFMWWLNSSTTYKDLMRWHAGTLTHSLGDGYSTFGIGGSNPWTKISAGDLISIGCDAPGTPVVNATMMRVVAG